MTPPVVLPAFPDLPGIRAFFTTRAGGVSEGPFAALNLGPHSDDEPARVTANWEILLAAQGLAPRPPALPRLCHGTALADADAGDVRRAEADAVFTRRSGRVVAVTTADCLAALVADPVTGCVAAVHAGWRGTRDDILGGTLARLFAAGQCRPASTYVALGPCLSPAALEIGDDVAATLPAAYVARAAGRARFDLKGCNRAQALAAGVPGEHITEHGGCTRDNPDLFFSYRAARHAGHEATGRMAACIVLA